VSESVCARDLCRLDGDAHNTGYVHISAAVFDILSLAHEAVLGFSGVERLLSWSLIRADARLVVHLSAGIPENDLRSDIATDWRAILKQFNTRPRGVFGSDDCP